MIEFIWDSKKDRSNFAKHSVDFQEAKSVFFDENARLIADPDHSENEDRFIMLGLSIKINVLVVVHCYKEAQNSIRIISARRATKKEIMEYEEFIK